MNEIYKITVLYAELSQPKQATMQKNSFLREKKLAVPSNNIQVWLQAQEK